MSRTSAILVLVLGALAASPIAASADPVADLHALFDREWERDLADNPLSATYLGDPRYNDRWPDISPAAEAARECSRREGPRRSRPHSARAAVARRAAQLRPVPARIRDAQGRAAVPSRVLLDRGERRPAVAERARRADAVRDGGRLRDLAPPHAGDPGLPRPVRGPPAPRRRGKAHAAARRHGARAGAAREAGDGQARGQPLLRALPHVSRRDPGGRPRAAHRGSEAGDCGSP